MLEIASHWTRVPGYLDTPSYGLPARATADALRTAVDAWQSGTLDLAVIDRAVERMRAAYATLVGAAPADVAFAASTSQVVGMVAASLPDGARVVVADGDFASVCFPFFADPRLDVKVVPLERIVAETRPGVDLVAVSAVQSSDGRVADLTGLAMAARVGGVRTLVDASHAAGWLPLHARDFDVVVSSAYKWLTTPRGIALAAIHPDATWIRPVSASWYGADSPWESLYGPEMNLSRSARRLDTSPPWQLVEAGATALELLVAQGVDSIYRHSVGLANAFRERVGLTASTSAIVAVDGVDPSALRAAGIRASARGGRARMGFYLYNDMADVDAAARAVLARVPQPA
ncbi:aminotransferase class V-fold PLP-dependent enzyme [Demequina sp.]|uniref:aminotransferase class V-fold PLP-dependent enzyme n=1 Tax=Demequina sp. TaxID=2050685 RepID=UPI0025D2E4A7|nr:aminotransferase class V-fold PLP-dependent enzyme [Demequina sp.]